jgi:hypothetical protein
MIAASTCGFRCGHSIAVGLGDGDEIAAQIDALDAIDIEQRRRQRRAKRSIGVGEFAAALPQHVAARAGISACAGLAWIPSE